jgi:putative NADH-flavin reductase
LEQTVKLVVLGANGRTGTRVLQAALDRDMDVTAVVRSASKQPDIRHEKLTVMVGDPCDAAFLKPVFRGQDAVISTLGGRRPTRSATSVYFRSADAIVEAAWDTGLKRVLVTSTALLFPRHRSDGRNPPEARSERRPQCKPHGAHSESVCSRLDVR